MNWKEETENVIKAVGLELNDEQKVQLETIITEQIPGDDDGEVIAAKIKEDLGLEIDEEKVMLLDNSMNNLITKWEGDDDNDGVEQEEEKDGDIEDSNVEESGEDGHEFDDNDENLIDDSMTGEGF